MARGIVLLLCRDGPPMSGAMPAVGSCAAVHVSRTVTAVATTRVEDEVLDPHDPGAIDTAAAGTRLPRGGERNS
jgi:hypothetical protein